MTPDNRRLDDLVAAVAEGRAVDWTALLAACRDDDERKLLGQLKILADIAQVTNPSSADGSLSESISAPLPVMFRWGPLDVICELGRGGFGRVYLARDPRLDREVALKRFDHTPVGDSQLVREAQLLARIHHPHVVVVHGAGTFDGTAGLWMELVRGRTLHDIQQEQGPFGPREATLIGLDLCAALAAVHGAGLVHRDIKANNVMRETGGRIVLMDFGAGLPTEATDSGDGIATGTPLYMAPELFEGAEASVSTDLYALGVLLFYLVTGRYPVDGQSLEELREKHARDARSLLRDARPDVPATLAQVIDRALSPAPTARFRSAAEMERALAATLDVHGRVLAETAAGPAWRRWAARPIPGWVALLSAPILITATVFVASIVDRPQVASRDGVVPSFWAGSLIPRGRQPLSRAQWEIIDGHHELAGSLADSGGWAQAAAHYQKVADLLLAEGWQDEPYRAHVMAMLGWAQTKAGKLDDARYSLDSALYMLAQEAGMNHPLRATIEMASAVERYARGDLRGSAEAMTRAIQIRHDGLAAAGVAVRPTPAIEVTRLAEALAQHAPDGDGDGDWLPDAIEAAVGLKPTDRDSDADGIPDDEEDLNGNGISNAIEWGIVADPGHVLGHFGSLDPERAGFKRERDFTGAPVAGTGVAAWRITAKRQGSYYRKLTESQKHAAVSRGWRLISVGTLREGVGWANFDLASPARFIQSFHVDADQKLALRLATKVIPLEGQIVPIADAPGAWPLTETVFDTSSQTASAFVGGRRVATGYRGCNQFIESWGLVMAATNFPTAPRGEADFSLVFLQIR